VATLASFSVADTIAEDGALFVRIFWLNPLFVFSATDIALAPPARKMEGRRLAEGGCGAHS